MAKRQVLMSCVQYDADIKSGAKSVLDVPAVATRLGLDGVEYREVYWHDREAELPVLAQRMRAAGLRTTFATFRTLFNADPAVRAGLAQDLEDTAALGSTILRVFRGVWPADDSAGAAMWDSARTLVKRAGELGVTLAIENFANTPGNKIADVVGIVSRLDPAIVGTNIDVSNYVINDEDPIAAIKALSARVRYAHLKDVAYGDGGKRTVTYLGAGSLPYDQILAELDATGQDFPLCFEFGGAGDPEKALKSALAYVNVAGGSMSELAIRPAGVFAETARTSAVAWSAVRSIFERISALERSGSKVIHLEIGGPDFDTPGHVKAAAHAALDAGEVHYSSNYGIYPLRQAIAQKLRSDNGLDYSPEDEIIVTTGASEAIHLTMSAIVSPGDEVLVPEPSWPNYRATALLADATPIALPLRAERGFELDPDDVGRAVTPRSRVLCVVTPQNPTGAVIRRKTLEKIAEIAARHNLLVISDEIYEKLVYDGREHVSFASLPGMRERTITINGFSKAYSMTGWRLGYLAAPRELVSPMVKIREFMTSCVTTFAQYGAVAALTGPQDAVAAMHAEFARRRALVVTRLSAIEGVRCDQPGGAFYAFPDVSGLGCTDREFANALLEKGHVAVVPGSAFGEAGAGHVRVSYATAYDQLEEAMGRIERVAGELRKA